MTVRFGNYRIVGYVAIFLLSATVLGLAARQANLFLPHLHKDFTIFALIVPSLTIFFFLLSVQWAQPQTEAPLLFITPGLWLAMGAWSQDIIGTIQCDALTGTIPTARGTTSYQGYCYQMKVMEAFSWMVFVLTTIMFIILLALVNQAQLFGREHIWSEPIRELGWFGERPGFHHHSQYHNNNGYYQGYPQMPMSAGMPSAVSYQAPPQGQYIQPMPGQSIVIQPGMNGAPPTITQIPHS